MNTPRQKPLASAPPEAAPPLGGPAPPVLGRPAPRVRLDFLDGLRGLCAVYIAFYHVHSMTPAGEKAGTNWLIKIATLLTQYGYYAVPVFIVLSGFCLMLPLARTADGQFRGGVGQYLSRRALRILPPYYFALAVAILVAVLTSPLQKVAGGHWNVSLTLPVILGHVFLLDDLFPQLGGGLDPPMWSVATEWQIYFVFPFLLLPLWRRFGNAVTLGAALVIGLAPRLLLGLPTDVGPPWYITLFAFGMVAAVLCFSGQRHHQEAGRKMPWLMMAGALCASWLVCVVIHLNWDRYRWISELLIGGAVTGLIAAYARLLIQGTNRPLPLGLRLLSSRWATGLGTFSYSIYLIHFPVLYTADMLLRTWHASFPQRFTALFVCAVPLAVGLSYLFHLAFERRFMSEFARPDP